MADLKSFLNRGSDDRQKHLADLEAKTLPGTKRAGRRKAHAHDADHISCLLAPEVGRQLRILQLDIRVELGLLVSEALRQVFALPDAEERLRRGLGKATKVQEVL